MTLSTLLADLYRRLNYSATPDADVTTRLTAFLNETQDEVLSQPSFHRLLLGQTTFTSVTGQWTYSLFPNVCKIRTVIDVRNQYRLNELPLDQFRTFVPSPSVQTGTPTDYVFAQYSPLQSQPTAPSQIWIASTAGEAGQILTYTWQRSSGELANVAMSLGGGFGPGSVNAKALTVGPDGLAAVPVDIVRMFSFRLGAPAIGTVTVHQGFTPGTPPVLGPQIGVIYPGTVESRFPVLHLSITPSGPLDYFVEFEREVPRLVNPNDTPILPERYQRILGDGARMKEYETRNDLNRFRLAKHDYDEGMAFLTDHVGNDSDDVPVPNGREFLGPSVLGPWFPISRYRRR